MASSEVEIVSDSTTESETADDDDDDVFTASAYGDMEKLRMFVEQDGAFLSFTDSRNGAYPLHLAANNNHPEIVQYIIEHGGDVNAVDDSQQTALHWAAQKGWILVADVLLQNGALVEAADVDGSTAVHIAAQYGQTSFLNNIVAKHNADFDVPDNDGRSPLHWAAYKNFPETVQYIIEHGGDVNLLGNSQQTALHCAAVEGSISVADVLLQNGALVEAADVCGNRAVHFAAQNGQTSFLHHIVVKHNADFDVPDNDGWSPLHWAASQGLVDTVKWLLSKDASQKRQDKDGRTPLHWAAIKGETEVCEVLIDSGTKEEIWLKDNEGNTPIQLAFATSRPHGAFLLSKGLRAECKHLEKLNLKRKALQKGTNRPVIIAMQGHAYTGKSVLAMQLASMLKFPIISLDDFLDATEPTDKQDTLISHTFNLIAQTVKRQIFLGFSVIVDSPLSRLSHLKKLVALVSTKNTPSTRLLIIECKPENEYAYQLRFEEGGSDIYAKHWYKPAGEWPLPKLLRDYTDDDIPPGVSKLVVDTTDSYSPCRLLQAVLDITSCGYGHITKYGAPWCVIHLDKSEQFTCPHCNTYSKSHGTAGETLHIFTLYEGVDHCDKLCGVCDNQVSGSCFTCQHCPLILHESCAELAHGDRKHFLPESFPIIMSADPPLRYAFPVEHPCAECRKDGNDFSSKCMNCLFESHLKSRLLPTVVRHKAEPGRMFTLCLNSNVANHMYTYMCLACKTYGVFAAYVLDAYGSPNTYHPECFLLPPSIHHTHGGHTHDLEMVTRREEEMEDYICDCCLNKMDPTAWYYYCSKCIVSMHLKCAFKDFDSGEWVTEA